ncbi:hypothetical protein LMG29660_02967 [Burkholderia puraquae]|uniref:2-aminoadipate transaminase n=1 Tax=Burkholderia puraquae TaxID=1904757 RepID=A0A6J5DRQ6_9BURK|nr:hypothetical protein LMG29660_02967 [Burkholderia puraquae]
MTLHIGATSKILAPGLRLGYPSCPRDSVALCAEAVRTTAWMPAPTSTLIAMVRIEDGTAERIMAAQLAEIRARVDLARELLPAGQLKSNPVCMFVWLRLPPPWRADDFAAHAKGRGVIVRPSSTFAVDRAEIEHGVRINLACPATRDELVNGPRILAGTLKDRPCALLGST